jgi:hypothetical protein
MAKLPLSHLFFVDNIFNMKSDCFVPIASVWAIINSLPCPFAALSLIFLEQIMRRWEAITARNSAMKRRLMRPMEIIYQGTRMREMGRGDF